MAKNSKSTTRARTASAVRKSKPRRSPSDRAVSPRASRPKAKERLAKKAAPRVSALASATVAPATKFVFSANPTMTLICLPAREPAFFSLDAAATLTGVHPEMLRYYVRVGLLEARHGAWESELYLNEAALDEVRRIEHYRNHLGVGRQALPLLCELRRECERREIELRFLNVS